VLYGGLITNVQILGACTSKNLGGQKPENFARFCTTFDFETMNILGIDQDIENLKQTLSRAIPAGFGKRNW